MKKKPNMLYAHCFGTGGWLCFSSILAVAQSEPREQCPGRGGLRIGTEMGNKKNDRDGPRPGSGFWNTDGNEMVQCYQFNWKLESSILRPWRAEWKREWEWWGKRERERIEQCVKGILPSSPVWRKQYGSSFFCSAILNCWIHYSCMLGMCMYAHVRFCVCVGLCMWINVLICVFVCVCVWLFGSLCSRCTGLLLCSDILNGWRRHFCGFPARRMGSPPLPSPRCSLVDNYRIGSALLAQLGFERLTWICQN